MIDTINSRRSFFFFPTCWALLLLLLVLPRNTNTQHKHHRPLHIKQYFPCRSESAFIFCRGNTGIIPCTVTLFETLAWSGSISAEGAVGRHFCSSFLSLWNFWIKAPLCSKGAQVTVLSHSRTGSLLCRGPEFHPPTLRVYLFSILHDTISLQVYDWRWSSILARSCPSVCLRAKTGAQWAVCRDILCETVRLKFLEAFKVWVPIWHESPLLYTACVWAHIASWTSWIQTINP
jgi:hypothetical protein